MFERYENDAKLGLYYAGQIASHRKKLSITPEDILLGLTWRTHAAECEFRGLKNDAGHLWSFVGVPHLPITEEPYKVKSIPLNQAAKRVLAYTAMEADRQGEYWIDLDHMLLGLLRENGPAAGALQQSGWTADRIRQAALNGRIKWPQKPVPWNWRIQPYRYWIIGSLVLAILAIVIGFLERQS